MTKSGETPAGINPRPTFDGGKRLAQRDPSQNVLEIEFPVNAAGFPLRIGDSESNLILFDVDSFGDGVFGGLVVAAGLRTNGGNTGVIQTGAVTLLTLQDITMVLANAAGGAFTITLGFSATICSGLIAAFFKIEAGANAVTIQPAGGDTIDGAATFVLAGGARRAMQMMSTGQTDWRIMSSR